MRLRKRKNLSERIQQHSEYLLIDESPFLRRLKEEERYSIIDTKKVFGNDNPVYLEVGCGKGGFATDMARLYPDVNFLAVEKSSNVIICALEKAKAGNLTNVKFICCDASNLGYYFEKDSIERVFLNFSCPWPKRKYENQRLTNERFLKVYDLFMTPDAEIWQKTDSAMMFEYSVMSLSSYGYALKAVTCDLANSDCDYNVTTEYERFFMGEGKPIYRLEAFRK